MRIKYLFKINKLLNTLDAMSNAAHAPNQYCQIEWQVIFRGLYYFLVGKIYIIYNLR